MGIEQIQTVVKKLLAKLVRFIKLAQEGELAEDYVDEFIKFLQDNQKELLALKLDSTVDELFELVYNYTVNFLRQMTLIYLRLVKLAKIIKLLISWSI